MSLYLALLDRRNVSKAFYPEQHFSCHLGHFSPSATCSLYSSVSSLSCTTPFIHLPLLSRDSLWHIRCIRCISGGNAGQIRLFPNNNLFFPLGTSHILSVPFLWPRSATIHILNVQHRFFTNCLWKEGQQNTWWKRTSSILKGPLSKIFRWYSASKYFFADNLRTLD